MLSRHFVGVIESLIADGETYTDVSVAKLIQTAKISRSAFYGYFDDKGDLLAAVAEEVTEDVSLAGNAWWSLPDDAGKKELLEALRPPVEAFRSHHAILRTVIEASFSDPRVRGPYHRLIDGANAALADHIRTCQARGTIVPGLDPEPTAMWLNLMNERGLQFALSDAPDDEAEALLQALTEIIWRTLYEGVRDPGDW